MNAAPSLPSASSSELLPLLRDLGVLPEGGDDDEMDALLADLELAEIDTSNDGAISLAELVAWWARTGRGPPPQRWAAAASKRAPAAAAGASKAAGTASAAATTTAPESKAKSAACVLL